MAEPAPAQPPEQQPAEDLLAVLEPDQLVAAKVRLGRRRLSPGLTAVLWALRAYVLFMLAAVALEVVRTLHGG